MKPSDLGKNGEDDAAEYLQSLGYEILARRFKRRVGEIDIVCGLQDGGRTKLLVFVEVKSRSINSFGRPEQAITKSQIRRIYRAAQVFVYERRLENVLCRFDAVAVYSVKGRLEIEHFENAFGITEFMDMD